MSFSHCFQRYRDRAFMISPYNRWMRAAVITVSDSCFRGQRVDISGPVVADLLRANAFQVISHLVVPDEQPDIEDALRQQCEVASLVVTTGVPVLLRVTLPRRPPG